MIALNLLHKLQYYYNILLLSWLQFLSYEVIEMSLLNIFKT
jgi:hypothetical protein